MDIGDYLKGPTYRRRVQELEGKLVELQEALEACAGRAQKVQELEGLLSELQDRYARLQALAKKYGVMELLETQKEIEQKKAELESVGLSIQTAQKNLEALAHRSSELQGRILVLDEVLLLESFALYEPKFRLNASHEYKTRLDGIRRRQKAMIKEGEAAFWNADWQVNGSKAEGRKLVNDMIKLVVRSFNNECDYCVDNVKFNNVETGEKRIRRSFEACNRLGQIMTVRLSEHYLNLKLDELHLAHEFQLKKQEEKEEARRKREELREQQKFDQEIRTARERIAKDRQHFLAALRDLHTRLKKVETEEERALLMVKISEVSASKESLDSEEKLIDYREQNAKAGYVYVVSNVGAFGDGVYKIGMTRRLDPMERIEELSGASVPFWFDVHAMVFSDNARELEAKLHLCFAAGRLNKVNGRKEFFRADISEIEQVIRMNYDALVEVIHEAPAEQYRESLRMTLPKAEIQRSELAAAAAVEPAIGHILR